MAASRSRMTTTLAHTHLSGPISARACLVCAPFALHSANLTDLAPGHSLVETLRAIGLARLLVTDWRSGLWGAARMGIRHGLYCLGCCWALMALLFVGGAMNLLWIAALTLLVAMEKLAPKGDILAKALGVIMIGAGAARLIWQPS